jgi:hypothetical protein
VRDSSRTPLAKLPEQTVNLPPSQVACEVAASALQPFIRSTIHCRLSERGGRYILIYFIVHLV